MKILLVGIFLFAVIGIGYPLVNEETSNACSALERRLITTLSTRDRSSSAAIVLGSLQSAFSNGSLVRSMVKQRSPNVPPLLTCGLAYWRVLFDPDATESMIDELAKSAGTEELIRTIDPKGAAAAEAEKAMRALANPTANPDATPGRSYPPRDQRELDRLIGTQR
jgi:hypothetical protein